MKKILIISPRFPFPVFGGDKLRIYQISKTLKEAGFSLTLISFIEKKEENNCLAEAEKIFDKVKLIYLPKWRSYLMSFVFLFFKKPIQVGYYFSFEMKRVIEKELVENNYQAVLVHLIRMADYLFWFCKKYPKKKIFKVLEMTDALSLFYQSVKEIKPQGFLALVYKLEAERVKKYEKRCLDFFDKIVVVSKRDKDWLLKDIKNRDFKNKEKVEVIPNAISERFLKEKSDGYEKNLIVFLGNLATLQNKDAVFYFAKEIFPLIKKEIPEAKFVVGGKGLNKKERKKLAKTKTELKGFLTEPEKFLKKAAVLVAPIRIGAGIQNKVLEAMALGVPVVISSLVAKGIFETEEVEFVAKNKEEFVKKIIEILKNQKLRNELAEKAENFIRVNYSFEKTINRYREIFS